MTETPVPPQSDDERLDAVQDAIDDAKQAEADLHDRDVLGDTGDDSAQDEEAEPAS